MARTERGKQLAQALTNEDGSPVIVDRIQIDVPIDGGFIWSLWSGGQQLFTSTAGADQVAGMLKCTGVVLNTSLGVYPPEASPAELN